MELRIEAISKKKQNERVQEGKSSERVDGRLISIPE